MSMSPYLLACPWPLRLLLPSLGTAKPWTTCVAAETAGNSGLIGLVQGFTGTDILVDVLKPRTSFLQVGVSRKISIETTTLHV